jgi:phosphoribosylamine---glycine ligase
MDYMESVLIIGGGGREHAILKALLRSDRPLFMYAYPGNPGMENDGCTLIEKKFSDWAELADWVQQNEVDLTIVGPEIPLVEGIVDTFRKKGLAIFGPTKKAAQIEGDKSFAKKFMKKYKIPTAAFETFDNKEDALAYLGKNGAPLVVKASGLAAGKGAVVCDTEAEAVSALTDMFDKKVFGDAGTTVVIEEKMQGEEASVFVLTDGKNYRILPVAQDHKRIGENDTGPNTGGMGAYSPCPLVTGDLLERIEREIIVPTLDGMRKEGMPYQGLLYAGVMVTPEGPKVVEFNCRFGDPETQAVLPLVVCDWYEAFRACCTGRLGSVKWTVRPEYCVAVVLASHGYPGAYEKGKVIEGIDLAEGSKSNVDAYHAGTSLDEDGNFITSGGRVLAISAWAESLSDAITEAYEAVAEVSFEGKTFRKDIAAKGMARLKKNKTPHMADARR